MVRWFIVIILFILALGLTKLMYKRDRIVIVVAHWNEDLEWLENPPGDCDIVIMDKEGSAPHSIPKSTRYIATRTKNIGLEASAYLQFIVDNYDRLPSRLAFIHGHEMSYHQTKTIFDVLKSPNASLPFYNFNSVCYRDWNPSLHAFKLLQHWWDTYFKPIVKTEKPNRIVGPCCAQFICSREAIRRIPMNTWKRLLKLSMTTNDSGVVFEMLWSLILGQKPAVDMSSCSECTFYTNKDEAIENSMQW